MCQFVAGAILRPTIRARCAMAVGERCARNRRPCIIVADFLQRKKYRNDGRSVIESKCDKESLANVEAKFPEKTAVTADEVCAWHEFEARASEEEGHGQQHCFISIGSWLLRSMTHFYSPRERALKQRRMRTSVTTLRCTADALNVVRKMSDLQSSYTDLPSFA